MSDQVSAIEKGNLAGSKKGTTPKRPSLRIALEPTGAVARFNELFSEWCSSILVKETRQALKSRQFTWTYFVLILCVAFWTVLGLSLGGSSYDSGRQLLTGYWVILGFPLGLIIPFSAYRSLSREYEDGTIQLISITTMKPYQIVMGKFGSASLQMLIYLSILAPCVMFTYMLRGISLQQIVLGMAVGVGGSIFLTILGIFLAGAFRSRALGVGVSVLFVLFLGWVYYLWIIVSVEITQYVTLDFSDTSVGVGVFSTVAFFGSTAALLLVVSISQISFASDNRSTRVRGMMLFQQTLFLASVIMGLATFTSFSIGVQNNYLVPMMLFAAHYWVLMGFLMNGESSRLSRRVQRSLPRSFFSKSFFSLLMPGAGRGFLFAVANLWACFLAIVLVGVSYRYFLDLDAIRQYQARWGGVATTTVVTYDFILACFVIGVFGTWFLAVDYLGMRGLGKRSKQEWPTGAGPLVSLIFGAMLVCLVSVGSLVVHFNFMHLSVSNYSNALVVNWYVVPFELDRNGFLLFAEWLMFFGVQAFLVIFLAIFVASKELLYRPIEVPERVAIDLKKVPSRLLPQGESIEEIFGELKNRKS